MEQKVAKASKKKLWSVYVFVETQAREGRILARQGRSGKGVSEKRLPSESKSVVHPYLYLNVTKLFKKDNVLHIECVNKEKHMHDIKRVVNIQVREYRRDGRIQ